MSMTQNLENLNGGRKKYHRLGGKVTKIKGEFKQQDSKYYLCIHCLFYIMVSKEDVRNSSNNRGIAGCTGTYLTGVSE